MLHQKLRSVESAVVGRRSEHSLYSVALATYGKGDLFDHKAAEGFIGVFVDICAHHSIVADETELDLSMACRSGIEDNTAIQGMHQLRAWGWGRGAGVE